MGFIDKIMPLFNVAFISVIIRKDECIITLRVIKGGKTVVKENKTLKTENNTLTPDLQKIINNYQNKYKFSFIATNMIAVSQGAIAGTTKARFSDFGINTANIEYLPVNNTWSAYALIEDIVLIKERFRNCGVDFIFSPFLIIFYTFQKEFRDKPTFYILVQETSITISVFKGNSFLFGANFVIATSNNDVFISDEDEKVEEEEFISLDDGDNDVFSGEDMIALDDLDNAENFDDFKVTDSIDNISDNNSENKETNLDSFTKGMDMFKFIKKSLEEFYKNPVYKNDAFIENIIIADAFDIPNDAISYIKTELLMNVEVKKIDLAETMISMAKEEVFN